MYTLSQVENALDKEPLSKALYTMQRFVAAQGLEDLSRWCSNELQGYENDFPTEQIPKCRMVNIAWLDVYRKPIIITGLNLVALTRIPLRLGVQDLEGYTDGNTGIALQFPDIAEEIEQEIKIPVLGAYLSPAEIKSVLNRIRLLALSRLHDVVPVVQTAQASANEQDASDMIETQEKPPTAFLSYSWEDEDDEDHKQWVHSLAYSLTNDGVAITLDQWHTAPGDRLPQFMERAVRENDFVLVVCTPTYKQKTDSRRGGVGYEGDIMTGEVINVQNQRKFIPILRNGDWSTALPTWMGGKFGIDLRGEPYPIEQYDDLLRTLHGMRVQAPPVGQIPERLRKPPIKIKGVIVAEERQPGRVHGEAVKENASRLSSETENELVFDEAFAFDIRRHSYLFSASLGDHRVLCVVPIEDIEDRFRTGRDKASLERAIRQNLSIIYQEAQRAYDEHGANDADQVLVRLVSLP